MTRILCVLLLSWANMKATYNKLQGLGTACTISQRKTYYFIYCKRLFVALMILDESSFSLYNMVGLTKF